jgi:glycosyltransferase involved in cell wall biosynthesis
VYPVQIERTATQDLRALAKSLLSGKPFLIVRDDRPVMRKQLQRLNPTDEFDVVHADQLNMAQFALKVPGARHVLDAHNSLWYLYQRLCRTMEPGPRKWIFARDWRLLKAYEGRVCRLFDAVISVSKQDEEALVEAGALPERIEVIPISIDTDEIRPIRREPKPNRIVHIGTMFWPPNSDGVLWFLREIWPIIRARRPDVEFDVIGMRPPREIVAYGGNSAGVNVEGYVEDPIPYLRRSAGLVVPLRSGGGMRVKILNALAQGMPVVTTSIGCEGIDAEDGRHLMVADVAEKFAEATLRILEDRTLADRLAKNGRQLVVERYDYRKVCPRLDEVYGGEQE